jgi:hypothetical protein
MATERLRLSIDGATGSAPPTRRATLGLGLAAVIANAVANWPASAQGGIADELHARLLGWSRMATGFSELSAGTIGAFMAFAVRNGITPESLADLTPDVYRGTPIEKRLLEAWFTGVFQAGGASGVRSYETTLMWPAAGVDPRPGACDGGPKRWASAPSDM